MPHSTRQRGFHWICTAVFDFYTPVLLKTMYSHNTIVHKAHLSFPNNRSIPWSAHFVMWDHWQCITIWCSRDNSCHVESTSFFSIMKLLLNTSKNQFVINIASLTIDLPRHDISLFQIKVKASWDLFSTKTASQSASPTFGVRSVLQPSLLRLMTPVFNVDSWLIATLHSYFIHQGKSWSKQEQQVSSLSPSLPRLLQLSTFPFPPPHEVRRRLFTPWRPSCLIRGGRQPSFSSSACQNQPPPFSALLLLLHHPCITIQQQHLAQERTQPIFSTKNKKKSSFNVESWKKHLLPMQSRWRHLKSRFVVLVSHWLLFVC